MADHADFIRTKISLTNSNILPHSFQNDSFGQFYFQLLENFDANAVINLRNNSHVRENSVETSLLTKEDHQQFLANYKDVARLDFICIHYDSSKAIGGINLKLSEYGLEIGKYIGEEAFLGVGIGYQMTSSLIRYANNNFSLFRPLCSITRLENIKNINLNLKLGFHIQEKINNEFWLMVR